MHTNGVGGKVCEQCLIFGGVGKGKTRCGSFCD